MSNLIVGFAGALVGATSSIVTVWIQTSVQANRDRLNVVKELAFEDHKKSVENAKLSGKTIRIPPVTLYLHYHLELAKQLEAGELMPRSVSVVLRALKLQARKRSYYVLGNT